MPKDKDASTRSKVRIFYAEIDGNDDAVEALVQAFGRATQPSSRVVKTIAITNGSKSNDKAPEETQIESNAEDIDVDVDSAFEDADGESTGNDETKSARRPRKAPTYQFVKQLDLRPEGKPSLKDFYAEKAPEDSQEQATVIVFYLQKILDCTGIGSNHLYTAYKELGIRSPPDISKIARNTAMRKGWLDTSVGNNLSVTVSGENFVEHDLPRNQVKK